MASEIFAALFALTVTGFISIGITTYFLGVAHRETQFTVSGLVLLISTLVAFTPLLLIVANPEARAALQEKARRHVQNLAVAKGVL
jgi:hypothetical protein